MESDYRKPDEIMLNSVPINSLPALIDRLLDQAGAPKGIKQKIAQIATELQSITGRVTAIQTESKVQHIFIREPYGAGRVEKFDVPSNQKEFQAELIRAQDNGLTVFVLFRKNQQQVNIIDEVNVFAGVESLPRY